MKGNLDKTKGNYRIKSKGLYQEKDAISVMRNLL